MKKLWFLRALGISLFLFTAIFLASSQALATTDTYIQFGSIGKSATDAQYLKWEIKAKKTYEVVLHMVDDNGARFTITFKTSDPGSTPYTISSSNYIVKIDTDYYDSSSPDTMTYEANLDSLINLILYALGGTHSYTSGDADAKIEKIRIYGDDFTIYSLTLSNSLNTPKWEINDTNFEDWDNVSDFEDADGDYSDTTTITFNNSYLHVTLKTTTTTTSPYIIDPSLYYGMSGGYGGYGYGTSSPYGAYGGYGTSSPYGAYGGYGQQTSPYGAYGGYGQQTSPYGAYGGYGQQTSPYGGYGTSSPYGGYGTSSPYGGYGTSSPYGGYGTSSPYGGYGTSSPYGGYGQQPSSNYSASYGMQPLGYSGYGQQPYGQQPYSAYGQQPYSNYAMAGAMNPLAMNSMAMNPMAALSSMIPPIGFPPMGLGVPPSGLGSGLGFDPFGFGLGMTGLGAFDPISIAALAGGFGGLGMGFGLF
jgi:hypothetical protein